MPTSKLKDLVIAGNKSIYDCWLKKHSKNPDEYQYVSNRHQIRGYYKLRSPELEVVLLDKYWNNSVYDADDFTRLIAEFDVDTKYITV